MTTLTLIGYFRSEALKFRLAVSIVDLLPIPYFSLTG